MELLVYQDAPGELKRFAAELYRKTSKTLDQLRRHGSKFAKDERLHGPYARG